MMTKGGTIMCIPEIHNNAKTASQFWVVTHIVNARKRLDCIWSQFATITI